MSPIPLFIVPILAGLVFAGTAVGQNIPKNGASSADAELARIRSQRDLIEGTFSVDERDCYQRFAVYDCIGRARLTRREAMADLRRQELAINTAEARRRGAEQLSKTEARVSPQALRETELRLVEAQANQQERLKSIDERSAERARLAQEATVRSGEAKARDDARAAVEKERAAQSDARAASRRKYEEKQQAAKKRLEDNKKRQQEPKNAAATPPAAPASAATATPANASGR